MRSVSIVLVILMGVASLSKDGAAPAPRGGGLSRAPHHDCCCRACPGPGLCPCDPGSATPCVRSSDDLANDMVLPSILPPVKLACVWPWLPPRPFTGERREEAEHSPHVRVSLHRLDKVPISLA